jgi:hypothetical protein
MASSATTTASPYREAPSRRGQRPALSEVHLAGAPRHVHRALAGVRFAALLVALVCFFLPFHVVHPLSHGRWGDRFCWAPDCPAEVEPPQAPPTDGPVYTCTGWSEARTLLPLGLLGALLLVALVPFRRPKFDVAFLLAVLDVLVLVVLAYALLDRRHHFDHVEPLVGERVFHRAMGWVVLLVAADVLVTPVLYVWARARRLAA